MKKPKILLIAAVLCILAIEKTAAQTPTPQQAASACTFTGAQLPGLSTYLATDLVGFKYTDTWHQIPIQVDERRYVNGAVMYNTSGLHMGSHNSFAQSSGEYDVDGVYGTGLPNNIYSDPTHPGKNRFLEYCDPNTWVGADDTLTFDSNDELTFLPKDGGIPAPTGSRPSGVDAASGIRIAISDPNAPVGSPSTIYVFIFKRATGSGLVPGAGVTYVTYNFKFGPLDPVTHLGTYGPSDYKTKFHTRFGPNHETSTVVTNNYTIRFSDRWVEDSLIDLVPPTGTNPSSHGINMIDRHKIGNVNTTCGISENVNSGLTEENSFANPRPPDGNVLQAPLNYEGIFIANIKGPLRAIRSIMGACSGPLTQRDEIFYPQYQVSTTFLRLHPYGPLRDFNDYNPAAGPMAYSDNNVSNIAVNGNGGHPVTPAPITWSLMTSPNGSLLKYYFPSDTRNVPPGLTFVQQSYYADKDMTMQSEPPITDTTNTDYQCTGRDKIAYGANGTVSYTTITSTGAITYSPATDPRGVDAGNPSYGYAYVSKKYVSMFLQPATTLTEIPTWISYIATSATPVVISW